jgi:hypothetical protein
MKLGRNTSTRGERWLGLLLTLDILAGAVWWYAWPWLGSDWLFLTVVALNVLLIGSAWGLMRRTRRRRESERAAQLEQEMWQGTLPASESSRASGERVV